MNYVLILLCVSALTVAGCASKRDSAPVAAKPPVEAAAPPDQPSSKAAPEAPKAPPAASKAPLPPAPLSPTSGFPMSPTDAVRIIEPKQAAYVGGGWGRSSDEAVAFKRADTYYNYIMLEHFLIIARNRMFTALERGEEYVVLNDRLTFVRSSVENNKRKYDRWEYAFIISKKADIDRARKIVESSIKNEEKIKRLQEFTETFTQEFWFDVTEVLHLRSEELFRDLGKKRK
ncbi:MAG: hypothetical protein FWH34_01440 [Desulfovibrionaceae bacterium]|nr:hypothetical protein [Desulfovibrionaceae bacterium]